MYVTNQYNNSVSIIDTATNKVTSTLGVGNQPWGVAVIPDGTKAYVANYGSSTVSIINATTNTVSGTVPVGPNPVGVAITPDGSKAYITNYGSDTVSVISTATNTVITTVHVGKTPYGVSISPDGTKTYVSSQKSDGFSVIDTATNTVTDTVIAGKSVSLGHFIVTSLGHPVLPVADFSCNVTSGFKPLSVKFTDQSEDAIKWSWDFGDGTNSTEQNPMHTYSTDGTYNIKLKVSNINETASKIATVTVQVSEVLPVADFSSNVTQGYAPLHVQFNDSSENATGWNWDFGDGETSTDQSPMHIYFGERAYKVKLTVSNAIGTDLKVATINVKSESNSNSGIRRARVVKINNINVNGSKDNINAAGTLTKPENKVQLLEQNSIVANAGQTLDHSKSLNTSGSGSIKTLVFEMFCGIAVIFAALFLYRKYSKN